jgi:hypothetical protein
LNSFRGFLRRGEKLTTVAVTDIDRHTVVIFATADVLEASTFVTAVTQHFSAHYRVFSGVIRGFLRRGERLTLSSCRLQQAITDIDGHTVVIFATADEVEASTFVTATAILHVELVSRFSPAWRKAHYSRDYRYRQTYGYGRHLRNRRRSCDVNVRGCSDPIEYFSACYEVFSRASKLPAILNEIALE